MPNRVQPQFQLPPPHDSRSPIAGDPRWSTPVQIAGAYFGIGILWIWLSDLLMVWSDSQNGSGFLVSASKGTLFVALSALFVYWLVRRKFHAIDRANSLLRAVADGTTDAVFVKDREGKYLLFNAAAAKLVGKSVADVLGRDDTELFDPESARTVMARDRLIMEAGSAATAEEVLTAAGVTRTYLATKAPYRDNSGAVVGLIGISRDITERKQSQNAVQEQEAFVRCVLNSLEAHIAVLDPVGVIVAVNESWRSFAVKNSASTGLSPRTGVGTNYLDICDGCDNRDCPDAAIAAAGIRRVLSGATGRFTFEYPCHSPKELRWFTMCATRLDYQSGGLVVTHTNITERMVAESETRQSREMLRLVLDNIPQGVFWKDRDSRFLGCNWVVARSMGLVTPDAIAGLAHADLPSITPDQAAHFVLKDREVMDAGIAQHHILEPMTLADGRTIWLDTNKVPLRNAEGRVIGILGTWEDVTDRRRAEEELRAQRDQLARIAETVPGVICTFRLGVDGTASFPYASPSITALYGLRPEDIAVDGSAIFALMPAEDAERVRKSIVRSALSLTPWRETYRVRRPGAREIWIEGHSTPTRESDGSTLWHGFLTDITERMKAEAVLRFQHALLQSQAEASPDGILVVSPDNRVLSYNGRFVELWGIPEELVAAGDDAPILATARSLTADPDAFTARVAAIYADAGMQSHDEVILADGRTLDRYSGPIRGDGGEMFGRVWFFRDITYRKQTESAVRSSEARLRLFIEHVPAQIAMLDRDMRYLHVSRRWLTDFGLDGRDLAGLSHYDLFPDLPERWKQIHRRSLAGAVERGDDDRFERADGTVQWLRWEVRPWMQLDGDIGGIIFFSEDMTARKSAEDALRGRERLLATVTENARVGLVVVDGNYRYLFANQAYADIFNLSVNDVVGRRMPDLLAVIWDRIRPRLDRTLAGERVVFELPLPSTDGGEPRWFRAMYEPGADDSGNPTAVIVVMDISEQKRADQSIQERERLLGIVTGSARVGLVVVSGRYEYLFANEAYAEIFGLDAAAIVGRTVPDMLAAGWSQIQPRLDRAIAGERVEYELSLPAVSGANETRTFRVMYEPRDDSGAPSVVVVVMEITEQRRAEAGIRVSEERYRRLVEVFPGGIFVNAGGKIALCNPGFVLLAGAAGPDELLGKSPFEIFHPNSHAEIRERITTMLETGAPALATELRIVRLDGRVVPVSSVAAPITGSDPPAVLVVLSDLSERERSATLLRSVMGSVADAIVTIDTRGTVLSANPATERQFGYSEAELVGGNVNVLMPEPYQREHDGYIANYLRTGIGKLIGIGREVTGRRKDGTTFPLELTVTEFQIDGERRFTGVVRDITARRQLEAQFHQAQKMEAVGRLAGGVAHDFNNLLTVINGYSDMVLDSLRAGDPHREFVAAIRDSGDRAARLTQQLLAFSRKAVIEPKVLDLSELVDESAKLLGRLLGEDIALTVVPSPSPVRVKADPGQLEQVVMNLAVNARDAMPTGGRLTIETREIAVGENETPSNPGLMPGRYALLAVADTGHGMTEEIKNKIFEPFFTTKGLGKGTGLGLAVVHGVVEQCGGRIGVDSTVGVGTTFTLLLPSAKEEDTGPSSKIVRLASQGTETVLLVEDDDAVRAIARLTLTMQGYSVLEAGRGEEAIQFAENHVGPIHILVSDVVMPEIGGRQLAEAIRKLRPKVLVLFMSGYTDDAVIQHGVESSDAFVQKPFTPLGLARKVRAVLDGAA